MLMMKLEDGAAGDDAAWGLGLPYEGDGDDIIYWEVCWREGVVVGLGVLFWVFFSLVP